MCVASLLFLAVETAKNRITNHEILEVAIQMLRKLCSVFGDFILFRSWSANAQPTLDFY